MKIGDLVNVFYPKDGKSIGLGIYLGIGSRGKIRKMDPKLFEFLWNGKIVTFDKPYWRFEVVNGSRRFN
tara:strand:- start:813 stop:1019 length:207 start_codon:yes stop_codon:yes gene_type:complete